MTAGRSAEVLALLGLARRAGKIAPGTERAREALRSGAARLIILASDAAPGQSNKLGGLLRGRDVPHVVLGERAELGKAVGGPPLSALAVTDAGFAKQMLARLTGESPAESRFR